MIHRKAFLFWGMAKIIAVANSKGGTGKSTLVYYLQQYLQDIGARAVILDLDNQKTVTRLSEDLGKGLPIIHPPEFGELVTLPWEFIIVDSPPYNAAVMAEIYRQASFVLVPVKASLFDAMAAETVIQTLRQYPGLRFACLLNQIRPGVAYNDQIREHLEAKGVPVMRTEMRQRVAYSRGVLWPHLRDEGDEKALQEIASIAAEILSIMAK